MKSNKKYYIGIPIGMLLVYLGKPLVINVASHYSQPVQCADAMDINGTYKFCLDEKFRVPLDCIFSEGSPDMRCRSLQNLAKNNEKSFTFELLGNEITVKKIH